MPPALVASMVLLTVFCCVGFEAHSIQINHHKFRTSGFPPPPLPSSVEQLASPQQVYASKELTPAELLVDLTNDLAFRILHYHSILNRNNFAYSPSALMSVLVALYEGSAGRSASELRNVLQLPSTNIIRIGYRDIHRRLRTYFFGSDNPLHGLSLNKDNVTITRDYEAILTFYGYDLGMDMVSSTATPPSTTSTSSTTTTTTTTTSTTTTTTASTAAVAATVATTTTKTTTTTTAAPPTTEKSTEARTEPPATTSIEPTAKSTAPTQTTLTEPTTTAATTEMAPTTTMSIEPTTTTTMTMQPTAAMTATQPTATTTTTTTTTTTESTPPVTMASSTESPTTTTTEKTTTTTTSTSEPTTITNTEEETTTDGRSSVETTATTTTATTTNDVGSEVGALVSAFVATEDVSGEPLQRIQVARVSRLPPPIKLQAPPLPVTPRATYLPSVRRNGSKEKRRSRRNRRHLLSHNNKDLDAGLFVALFDHHSGGGALHLQHQQQQQQQQQQRNAALFGGTGAGAGVVHELNNEFAVELQPHIFGSGGGVAALAAPSGLGGVGVGGGSAGFIGGDIEVKANLNTDVISHVFYLSHQQLIHTTFKVYNAVLYFKYFDHLKMSVLELELDTPEYNLMILLPDYHVDLVAAAASLRLGPTLRMMRKQLTPKWVQAIIPDFQLHGTMFLTNDLQNMGILDIFEPNRADFHPMTNENRIYVKHIEQSINVNIRTRPINQLKRAYGSQTQPIQISVSHPFLFFVIDRELDIAVMSGRILNPQNVRIQ